MALSYGPFGTKPVRWSPSCRGGSVRAANVQPLISAGSGGAELVARGSSAPPLPAEA